MADQKTTAAQPRGMHALLQRLRGPVAPPPTVEEARASFLSACAGDDVHAQAQAWRALHDAFARTAGRGCA